METAINIGYACRLLRSDMTKHIVRLEDNVSISSESENIEEVSILVAWANIS
jgi:hypothetical protein